MRRKRMFTIVLILVLAAVFIGGPTAAFAADQKVTRKMILGGRLGDGWFVLSQALAYFINKQSDWLRVEVVATPGASAGAEIASKDYEKYIYISPFYSMKLNPTSKRIGNYDKERIIGYCTGNVWTWITYDDKIKTAGDFAGKKVFVGRPGGSRTFFELAVLEQLGVQDKVKVLNGGYGGGRNALRDGLADIAVMNFDYILPAGFKKGALIEDLETRKPVQYINIMSPELQQKLGMVPLQIYAGALDKKTQKDAVYASMDAIFWCADERQDPKIVREVARILYENADKFASWHAQGAGISKDSVPTWVISKEQMHPAALKYYEEQGIAVKPLSDLLP